MQGVQSCDKCGSRDLEEDVLEGHGLVCASCGHVVEKATLRIVSSLEYSDAGQQHGSFLSHDHATHGSGGTVTDPNDAAFRRVYHEAQQIAEAMGLVHLLQSAMNSFKLAQSKGFTAGRSARNLACACLYVRCRQLKSPYLLSDFATHTGVSPFVLGGLFLKLVQALGLTRQQIPLVDPALFLPRLVARLQLGEDEARVERLALRIVARMDRDWLMVGRNPAGICGAALHLACKMCGLQRALGEVVAVVTVCERTIRYRVSEFLKSPSAQLTLEEFQQLDLDEAALPPAFERGVAEEDVVQWSQVDAEMSDLVLSEQIAALTTPSEEPEAMLATKSGQDEPEEELEEESLSELEDAHKYIIQNEYLVARKEREWEASFGAFAERKRLKLEEAKEGNAATPRYRRKGQTSSCKDQPKEVDDEPEVLDFEGIFDSAHEEDDDDDDDENVAKKEEQGRDFDSLWEEKGIDRDVMHDILGL